MTGAALFGAITALVGVAFILAIIEFFDRRKKKRTLASGEVITMYPPDPEKYAKVELDYDSLCDKCKEVADGKST